MLKLSTDTEKVFYNWLDFDDDIQILTNYIRSSHWTPNYIVGVKRGGLVPAIKLSHIFNKPLIMMSCQLRDSKDKEVRLYEVEEIPNDKNILIVDDICDSGITLSKIILQFYSNGFCIDNIKTCSLIYNTSQNFIVDYYSKEIDRNNDKRWVIFPWET
jgi:hypoxanthine phosphoribosyltransferase